MIWGPGLHDAQSVLQDAAVLLQGRAQGHCGMSIMVGETVLTQRTPAGRTE